MNLKILLLYCRNGRGPVALPWITSLTVAQGWENQPLLLNTWSPNFGQESGVGSLVRRFLHAYKDNEHQPVEISNLLTSFRKSYWQVRKGRPLREFRYLGAKGFSVVRAFTDLERLRIGSIIMPACCNHFYRMSSKVYRNSRLPRFTVRGAAPSKKW